MVRSYNIRVMKTGPVRVPFPLRQSQVYTTLYYPKSKDTVPFNSTVSQSLLTGIARALKCCPI